MFGEGEWAAAKHGGQGKRGWKKLHLGVNRSGVIVAQALTDATADDALTGIRLIRAVDGDVAAVTADPAYDTITFYDVATERGAKVVVPPAKTVRLSRRGPRSRARDRTIRQITKMGRRQWEQKTRYHRQARVENAIFLAGVFVGDLEVDVRCFGSVRQEVGELLHRESLSISAKRVRLVRSVPESLGPGCDCCPNSRRESR